MSGYAQRAWTVTPLSVMSARASAAPKKTVMRALRRHHEDGQRRRPWQQTQSSS